MTHCDDSSMPSRLTEYLAADHAKLQLYLGGAAFSAIGRRYAAKYPKLDPGLRWFSRNLDKFLGETTPYSGNPELAELACLEAALNSAFEAPVVPLVTVAELAQLDATDLEDCTVSLHPSVRRLCFRSNTTSLWAALQCNELPPRPKRLDAPQELLVWRQGTHPRFRMLGPEEATALSLALDGIPFGKICRAVATQAPHAGTNDCAQTYLRGWVEAELVSSIRNLNDAGEK